MEKTIAFEDLQLAHHLITELFAAFGVPNLPLWAGLYQAQAGFAGGGLQGVAGAGYPLVPGYFFYPHLGLPRYASLA